jgi:hypothetical protein
MNGSFKKRLFPAKWLQLKMAANGCTDKVALSRNWLI